MRARRWHALTLCTTQASGHRASTPICAAGVLRDGADMHSSGPVICAIDFDDLAPQLISAARTLGHGMGAHVHVVHVVAPGARDSRSDDSMRSRRLLLPPRPAESVAAEEELAAIARDLNAASIVVASRGPGPLSTMVGGSVAQELTTRSHCPVVVVPSVVA